MDGILLFIIGLLMHVIDINIPTSIQYEKYILDDSLGTTFQMYVTEHFIGERVVVDILPDFIGFILILIGLILIFRIDNSIIKALPFLGLLLAKTVVLPILPLISNGRQRLYSVLFIVFLGMLFEIFMEYFILSRVVRVTNATQNKRNNIAVKTGWFISIICKVIIFITTFAGVKYLTVFYTIIYIGSTVFYCYKLYGSRAYLQRG